MEHIVLNVLQFDMGLVTPVSYSERLLAAAGADEQMSSLFHVSTSAHMPTLLAWQCASPETLT
jgi:Ca2+/Na+ antiporter